MKYRIEFDYTTGNSFGSELCENEPLDDFEWENLETAKRNLKRIKEHYKWYDEMENLDRWALKKGKEKPKPPKWRKVRTQYGDKHALLNLILDNEKEVQFYPPWCGYFETLHSARIKSEDPDMEFML